MISVATANSSGDGIEGSTVVRGRKGASVVGGVLGASLLAPGGAKCAVASPLRPSGGRGRGPLRSNGRVRWVSTNALESPASPLPSPPSGAEREPRMQAVG